MKHDVIVDAIIRHDEEVLLTTVEASSRILTLPSYLFDFREDPKELLRSMLVRDVELEPSVIQLYDAISTTDSERASDTFELHLVYLVNFSANLSDITGNREEAGMQWVKLRNLQPSQLSPITRMVLNIRASEQYDSHSSVPTAEEVNIAPRPLDREVTIHTDGGSRGNPGPSAAAFVVLGEGDRIVLKEGKYLGITTNNQAEYQAVKLALEVALRSGVRVVHFKMDSMLVVNQILGLYQIKNRELWPVFTNIKELMKKFDSVTFHHVKREFNKEADALVNKVLDEYQSHISAT